MKSLSFWTTRWPIVGAMFTVSAGVLGLVSCRPKPERPPARIDIVFDITVADRLPDSRRREALVLSQLSDRDRAGLYVLDQSCREVFSPDQMLCGGDQDDILSLLVKRISPSGTQGTFPHRAWSRLAREVAGDSRPTVLIWETDGDQDQINSAAREETNRSIMELAQQPHLRLVVLVGVNVGQYERVREELAPLKERLVILGSETPDDEVAGQVAEALQSAPRPSVPAVATSKTSKTSKGRL